MSQMISHISPAPSLSPITINHQPLFSSQVSPELFLCHVRPAMVLFMYSNRSAPKALSGLSPIC